MEYIAACDTDVGITKKINQDSVCIKTAKTNTGRAALILVCDGMGGLSRGELASAEVVRSFAEWFDRELPFELPEWDWHTAAHNVISRLRRLNAKLVAYGRRECMQLGTTATGIIAVDSQFMTFHVGDTRIYKVSDKLSQLTDDQMPTFRLTPGQGETLVDYALIRLRSKRQWRVLPNPMLRLNSYLRIEPKHFYIKPAGDSAFEFHPLAALDRGAYILVNLAQQPVGELQDYTVYPFQVP